MKKLFNVHDGIFQEIMPFVLYYKVGVIFLMFLEG